MEVKVRENSHTYRQIYEYIKNGKYPEVLEKCATILLVGNGPSFSRYRRCIITLVACFYVNVRLAMLQTRRLCGS